MSMDANIKRISAICALMSLGLQGNKRQPLASCGVNGAHVPRGKWGVHVGGGDRYDCVDYAARELAVGGLHFLRIDMGYEIPLGKKMRKASGEPDKVEKNQCVCAHLALGLGWGLQGRPKRIPDRTRAKTMATRIRRSEFQQAKSFMGECSFASTKVGG